MQSELFVPFDLLSDLDRSVLSAWDLLDPGERDGVPVPAVFAVGPGRVVLARSIDTMTRQVAPETFLAAIRPGRPVPPKRRLVIPRLLQHIRLTRRVTTRPSGG